MDMRRREMFSFHSFSNPHPSPPPSTFDVHLSLIKRGAEGVRGGYGRFTFRNHESLSFFNHGSWMALSLQREAGQILTTKCKTLTVNLRYDNLISINIAIEIASLVAGPACTQASKQALH